MKFLFVVVLLVCTNLLFSQRGNAITPLQGCGTTSKSEAVNIHVHCSAQEEGCGTASKSEPINIHVHCSVQEKGQKGDKGTPCDCGSLNAIKPSAHLEPLHLRIKTYAANQVIRDWSLNSSHTHLAGGMKYRNGQLTVPTFGRYYIYTQIYFRARPNRILVMVNSASVTLLQPMVRQGGNMFVAGVFKLNAGDVVMLQVSRHGPSTVYMSMRHCYFGAYLI
ncbi:PREDICTED: uncharacterized protein LOC107334772 isoform X4 [Acropora digitifera]|uniref:uncharacterized protein LOC107334772 isoform X4 n=1 Tax=Acropora digitifera TaxID=70779 RepID=UPI00077A8ECB|nr:PREDICTED: uncharacterized protein LOC107334772 isoform X4 [Acropora digitifera]